MNQAIFLVTGIFQTLAAQYLFYNKAASIYTIFLILNADNSSLLTVLSLYLGMMASGLYSASSVRGKNLNHSSFATVAILEVIGNIVLTVGLFYVGSGLYQVIYSSVIVFNALLSKFWLKRHISIMQWLAVVTITVGLSLNAIGKESSSESFYGFLITLFGTAILSTVYTLNDYFLTNTPSKYQMPTPIQQCFWVGTYCTLFCSIIIGMYCIPSIMTLNLSPLSIQLTYVALVVASLGHSIAYFELLKSAGAVATGVIQALRAVLVFVTSHIVFCGSDPLQCYTPVKGLSTIIVISGIVGYSLSYARSTNEIVEFAILHNDDVSALEVEIEDALKRRY